MNAQPADRAVPFTISRASTELVRSRKQLDAARRSLRLALDIFGRLNQGVGAEATAALERVLAQLEEAEAELWEVAQ